MTGVLAGYEDATGADVRRCRRFVGTTSMPGWAAKTPATPH
jgi:hypothetical protein